MGDVTGAGPKALRDGDPRVVGGYRLLARIGEGGMGSVFLTRSRGGQPLALKVIRAEHAQDGAFRERFAREVEAASRVAGYHLLPVLDFDVEAEHPWMVTAYKPGLSLHEVLAAYGPLPVPVVLQLTGCVALALQSVHTAGFVHRDVKPGNILVTGDGPWVIDFGIARAGDAGRLTATGALIGTLQYMSPEHALGRELTAASDIFALGLVAAVAATGRHPYGDATGPAVAARIAASDTRPPDLSGYPAPLAALLEETLAADPGRRPTGAAYAERCGGLLGRPVREPADWLPAPVRARAEEVAAAAAERLNSRPGAPVIPPRGADPRLAVSGGGEPTPVDKPAGEVPARDASPGPGQGRRRTRTVVAAAVATAVVGGVTAWVVHTAGSGETSSPPPKRTPKTSTKPSTKPAPKPTAPPGYRLIFAKRPFTFGPPPSADQWNNIDFDIPQTTTFERGVLQGPAELTYSSDGIVGSIFAVDGKRTTVCDLAEKTTSIPHPLSAAELRLGRVLKPGLLLCSITSNDKIAEVLITEVVPGSELPTFNGHVTLWERPDLLR